MFSYRNFSALFANVSVVFIACAPTAAALCSKGLRATFLSNYTEV